MAIVATSEHLVNLRMIVIMVRNTTLASENDYAPNMPSFWLQAYVRKACVQAG